MKRFAVCLIAFATAITFCLPQTWARTERSKVEYNDRQTFKGEVYFRDRTHVEPIIINHYGQLRAWAVSSIPPPKDSWSGTTVLSGESLYYRMKPGRRHIVDLQGIMDSLSVANGWDRGGTTAFQYFTGVTLVMFDAAKWPGYEAEVIYLTDTNGKSGVGKRTGFEAMASGVSKVWIVPFTAGTTNFSEGMMSQNMLAWSGASPYGNYVSGSGGSTFGIGIYNNKSGASVMLSRPTESVKILALDSAVSFQVLNLRTFGTQLGNEQN